VFGHFVRVFVLLTIMVAAQLPVGSAAASTPRTILGQVGETRAPVEVLAMRTERERRFVNPDGSWTLEQYAEPVRVRQRGGSWADIDTTLRRAGDRVRPAAALGDVSFSGGGTGELAELHTGHGRLALSWPGKLPAPTLDGDTATYAEVRPGVDLVLRATTDGFSHVLVVKNRDAARTLKQVRFGLDGDLDLATTSTGELAVVTATGAVAATAGQALMWDNRGGSTVTTAGETARKATPPMRVEGGDLVIEPDQKVLTAPDVAYPVYIDPSYAKGIKRWAFANSTNENNDSTVVRVGKSPDSAALYRSYATFDVSSLRGKRIFNAKFQTLLVHSWACEATPVNLYRVDSAGSGRLAWSGPALAEWVDQRSGNAHKGSNACGNQPDQPMEFSNRLTTEVSEGASANRTELSLALSARQSNGGGESTEEWWKKFSPGSLKLVVVYNSAPNVPGSLSADGRGCGTSTNRPAVSASKPTLRAVVSDPDGDETDLRASFTWEQWNGTAWVAMGSGQQTNLRTGATGQVTINSGITHGGVYRWRVQTIDPWGYNGTTGTDSSTPSGWCEFSVDLVGPDVLPEVSSTVYGSDINQTYGAVGLTGNFTLGAGGVADVVGYKVGWQDPPSTVVTAPSPGAGVTVPLTPPPPKPEDPTAGGLTTLYVLSVDGAGRTSPLRTYEFNVGSATAPVGVWEMSEPSGSTTLADTNQRGTARPATLTSGTAGATGRILNGPGRQAPKAVTFNGSTSYAATAGPVVDTSKSLSVSAWVRLSSAPNNAHTAVVQKGTNTSGFFLTFNNQRWAFATHSADATSPTVSIATSATPVAIGRWTHVLGVYDAGTNQLRIYVNGELTGTATRAGTPWHASGPLWIGRGFSGGAAGGYLPGDIAEVKVWDRVVSEPETEPMAATLVGRWDLDGDGTDATDYGRDLGAATGTVGWTDDRDGVSDGAAGLATGLGWLATAGPVVRTDQNYTVSAWVRMSDTNNYQTFLCQFGSSRCAFYLQYSLPHDRWGIVLPSNDGSTVDKYWAATGSAPPAYDEWVHLTAVVNASSGVLRFYVNGVQEEIVYAWSGAWHANGPLRVGFMDGGAIDGAIDDVRVYAGVLSPTQITRICGC
jgi:Concanavalin A-like lectin/glucanases superfamily